MHDVYSNAFKEMICTEICIEHRSIVDVSQDYNICRQTLKLWINEYIKDSSCFKDKEYDGMSTEEMMRMIKKQRQKCLISVISTKFKNIDPKLIRRID